MAETLISHSTEKKSLSDSPGGELLSHTERKMVKFFFFFVFMTLEKKKVTTACLIKRAQKINVYIYSRQRRWRRWKMRGRLIWGPFKGFFFLFFCTGKEEKTR